jgi:hypothetical protein
MSAQGGTLKAPIHVPVRSVIAAAIATVLALGIGFGVRELVQEPARTGGAVVELDWGSHVGHPQFHDRDGSAGTAPDDRFGGRFRSHQQL